MGVSFSWRPGPGNTGSIVHGRGRADALPVMVPRLAGGTGRTVKSAGDAWNTLLPCRGKKRRIMCQKASRCLHREATEASSRPGLIYFDSCANSPFNYLLLRLEKHLERSGGRGSGLLLKVLLSPSSTASDARQTGGGGFSPFVPESGQTGESSVLKCTRRAQQWKRHASASGRENRAVACETAAREKRSIAAMRPPGASERRDRWSPPSPLPRCSRQINDQTAGGT